MTYHLNTGISDQTAVVLKEYAAAYGISMAAAVRILLRQALDAERARVTDSNPGRNHGQSPFPAPSRSVSSGPP